MGTTLVAVLVEESTARYWVGNVGDSRVYLLGGSGLSQLTHDHSLVADRVRLGEITEEEARTARHRNVITRAIGVEARVEPEVLGPLQFRDGDRLLLCSDGLHGMVTDDEIATFARSTEVESLPDQLIDAANAAGGRDNVTVVVGTALGVLPVSPIVAAGHSGRRGRFDSAVRIERKAQAGSRPRGHWVNCGYRDCRCGDLAELCACRWRQLGGDHSDAGRGRPSAIELKRASQPNTSDANAGAPTAPRRFLPPLLRSPRQRRPRAASQGSNRDAVCRAFRLAGRNRAPHSGPAARRR